MNQDRQFSLGTLVITLLVGATAGALLVVLRTPVIKVKPLNPWKTRPRDEHRGVEAAARDEQGLLADWKEPGC
jgi:hypothetical protein